MNIGYHRIGTVIDSILKHPETFPLPNCTVETDCDDCGLWTYHDPRDHKPGSVNSFKYQAVFGT